jgi:hypothetical protein
MPYKHRECYLGSSSALGYLDKGGRWRKRDWWRKPSTTSKDRKTDRKALAEEFKAAKQADEALLSAAIERARKRSRSRSF